jgi:hypothetical protein
MATTNFGSAFRWFGPQLQPTAEKYSALTQNYPQPLFQAQKFSLHRATVASLAVIPHFGASLTHWNKNWEGKSHSTVVLGTSSPKEKRNSYNNNGARKHCRNYNGSFTQFLISSDQESFDWTKYNRPLW